MAMVAPRIPTGVLTERRMTHEQRVRDGMYRHFDAIDAEIVVGSLLRDYEIKMLAVPCPHRPSVFHITFASPLNDMRQAVFQGICDGMLLHEVAIKLGVDRKTLAQSMRAYARRVGALYWGQLVPIGVYFGIWVPTMFLDKGEYLT